MKDIHHAERPLNILSNAEQHALSKSDDDDETQTETEQGIDNEDEGPMAPPNPQVSRTDTITRETDSPHARYGQPDQPSGAHQSTPDEKYYIFHILTPNPIPCDNVTRRERSRSRTRETRSRPIP